MHYSESEKLLCTTILVKLKVVEHRIVLLLVPGMSILA